MALAIPLQVPAVPPQARVLKNPYEKVDWDAVTFYMANLHCHTLRSDGRGEPGAMIRSYAEAGYSILALTDHDHESYYVRREGEQNPGPFQESTWPWSRWINDKPSRIWKTGEMEIAAFYPDLGRRGMLAIRGDELSSDPHIVSLFTDCRYSSAITPSREHDHERIGQVGNQGGLAFWAHPALYAPPYAEKNRFNSGTLDGLLDYLGGFLGRYDFLLGIEFTQMCVDGVPGSGRPRPEPGPILDWLLNAHYRQHDLWLFGNDDNHQAAVADNAVFTWVLASELTLEAVRAALTNGHLFAGKRAGIMPEVKRISVDEETQSIRLEIEKCDKVIWIKNGQEHSEGLQFNYAGLTDSIVRFEMISDRTRFYSQAFYIGKHKTDGRFE